MLTSLALLVACQEYEVAPRGSAEPSAAPDVVARPESLTLGPLASGEVEEQSFLVRNVGAAALRVDAIRLDVGQEAFTLLDTDGFTLDPDDERPVRVRFSPVGDVSYGLAVVVSDDPDTPELGVPLEGLGQVPALQLSPAAHTFPGVCDDSVVVELKNIGLADLDVTRIDYAGAPELSLESTLALPLTLVPGDHRDVIVRYGSGGDLSATGTLAVTSTDPRGVRTADQFVEGSGDLVREEFVAVANPAVDILFAVDKSCSMSAEARALGAAFDQFIQEIDNVTDDWQIGVVWQDHGCFERGVITASTPDYVNVFKDAVAGGIFGDTDLTEQLLELSDVALQQTAPGRCNAGFVRGNALLHVVAVSDEPEQSGQPWDHWVGRWQTQMSDPNLVMVSAVVDAPPAGDCGEQGTGYIEAAQGTGGVLLDVCTSNWGSYAQQLGQASAQGLLTYLLSSTPDPDSIVVSVDGTAYDRGWHYDAVRNAIVVDVELPEGTVIEVEYLSLGC